jgi:hypothetical protein
MPHKINQEHRNNSVTGSRVPAKAAEKSIRSSIKKQDSAMADRLEDVKANKSFNQNAPPHSQKANEHVSPQITLKPHLGPLSDPALRDRAHKEYALGRPLVLVQVGDKERSASASPYRVGDQFYGEHRRNPAHNQATYDLKSIYTHEDILMSVLFGEKNHQVRSLSSRALQEMDPQGILITALLAVNAKTFHRPDMLGAIALTAASLSAGYFGPVPQNDAKQAIAILSQQDRADALGLALITASRGAFYPLSEALLTWGADVHAGADDDGSMPLEIALQNRDIKLAYLLLAHGADPDRELVSGETCRQMAKEENLVVFTKRLDSI